MSKLERLLYLQGNRCFFCDQPIPKDEATVEHLLPKSKGGGHDDDNCVVCCRMINVALGDLSVKEKIRALLNQRGTVVCPAKLRRSDKECVNGEPPEDEPADEDSLVTTVVKELDLNKHNRPKKRSTLRNAIRRILGSNLSDEAVEQLILEMVERKYLVVEGTRVRYPEPGIEFFPRQESFEELPARHGITAEPTAVGCSGESDDAEIPF